MVQQLFLTAPNAPSGPTRAAAFQSVTTELVTVTAEAAGSSPVVPAIHFQKIQRTPIQYGSIWVASLRL